MNRAIVVGSPRVRGRSAALAEELFEACIEEYPDDQISLIPLSSITVAPCTGCDFCKNSEGHACCIEDDMDDVREVLDEADELTIVSPVYFAGPPSTLKAFLDRLQPYFWTDARRRNLRPAVLHVIGEGHDPFGFDPLVGTVKSAAFTAGFKLERVMNWVGKIDASGEIIEDAQVESVSWSNSSAETKENLDVVAAAASSDDVEENASSERFEGSTSAQPKKSSKRLVLDDQQIGKTSSAKKSRNGAANNNVSATQGARKKAPIKPQSVSKAKPKNSPAKPKNAAGQGKKKKGR